MDAVVVVVVVAVAVVVCLYTVHWQIGVKRAVEVVSLVVDEERMRPLVIFH